MYAPRSLYLVLLICLVHFAPGPGIKNAGARTRIVEVMSVQDQAALSAPNPSVNKAATDTVYILGGADRQDGRFQDDIDSTIPDNEGWVTRAEWYNDFVSWKVDTFNAANLDTSQVVNHAMWCGDYFLGCDEGPANPGYGNDWNVALQWQGPVDDDQDSTQVRVTARINHDTEQDYDYLFLEVLKETGWTEIRSYDGDNRVGGEFVWVLVDETFTVAPADYVDGEIQVRWRFYSDAGYSDEDCIYPTDGGAQIDNIAVIFDQGEGAVLKAFDDFEGPQAPGWVSIGTDCGTGKIWPRLGDAGLTGSNMTPQLAFVDIGTECDFSDGTPGVRWVYGPDALVLLCDGIASIRADAMLSPPLTLPVDLDDYDGARLEFDVYGHSEEFSPNFNWAVRSSRDGGLSWSGWKAHGVIYEMGKPNYSRRSFVLDSLLLEGADTVQISLGYVVHPLLGAPQCEGFTPAPYFDNVALKLFKRDGPYLYTNSVDSGHPLLQDAFPANGGLNLQNPGSNSVPVQSNHTGGPVRIRTAPRHGAALTGPPELHWKLKPNPLFDSYRTVVPPNPVLGDSVSASLPADPRAGVSYAFTFPDSGWFYPGDILHYYFEAGDDLAYGSGTSMLPADTTGFGYFSGDPGYSRDVYDRYYVVRALPSLTDTIPGAQPRILVWQDYFDTAEDDAWHFALADLGFHAGQDYDLYQATHPNFDIAGTAAQVIGYDIVLYGCGEEARFTLTDHDAMVLENWLGSSKKNLLLLGDNLAEHLDGSNNNGDFLRNQMGASLGSFDVRPYIDGQAVPVVKPRSSNTPGLTVRYRANSTFKYSDFDGLTPYGTGVWLSDYEDPLGMPASYPYAAGIYNYLPDEDSHVITLPVGLEFIVDPVGTGESGQATRSALLGEILDFFGSPGSGGTSDVPMARELTVSSYPNPFNPSTTIAYSMPGAGHLQIKLYDLRGRLVRTLHDQQTAAGRGVVKWDGTDTRGSAVSSGVYFCRVAAGSQERLLKLSMVK